jgi:predicted O-methyltransferase YrrM
LYDRLLEYKNEHIIPAISFDVAIFLEWFVALIKPRNILEIGFGSGVSSVFLKRGFIDSKIVTLEKDNNRFVRGNDLLKEFKQTGITLIQKDAFEYIETTENLYDLIFLDAVKREYVDYIDPVKKILKNDGILITDNILFGGKVIKDIVDDKYKDGVDLLRSFNKRISKDEELYTFFLLVGDGLSISVKK